MLEKIVKNKTNETVKQKLLNPMPENNKMEKLTLQKSRRI